MGSRPPAQWVEMNPDKNSKGWTEICPQLRNLSKPGLLALVQDLVERMADHIGWGYGDTVRDPVARLEEALAGG